MYRNCLAVMFGLCCLAHILLLGGCSEDPDCTDAWRDLETEIGELYEFCFLGDGDCRSYSYGFRLHLDTRNLPDPYDPGGWYRLLSVPEPGIPGDQIYYLSESAISGEDYQRLDRMAGWKLVGRGAKVAFCEACYTDCGLADVVELNVGDGSFDFVYDPLDSLSVYIEVEDTS